MPATMRLTDGRCAEPTLAMRAGKLLGVVCVAGGAECPLLSAEEAAHFREVVGSDPTATIRLTSPADEVPHYRQLEPDDFAADPEEILNCKRDLDVLQRLGLVPGDVRRARYLYELLLERIETPDGLCAYDAPGWEGCVLARSGVYESVRAKGWSAIVFDRTEEEKRRSRESNAQEIETAGRLFVRPHHLMCMACWYGGTGGESPRPNDTIFEICQRLRREPTVPVTLVEGCCVACDCCDGFHPGTGRCVHSGGLIRDYKKDLDCFQKLGLMPGATMPANDLFALIFERIPSTRDICGYGDGVVRSHEWSICSDPEGNPGYAKARERGLP